MACSPPGHVQEKCLLSDRNVARFVSSEATVRRPRSPLDLSDAKYISSCFECHVNESAGPTG